MRLAARVRAPAQASVHCEPPKPVRVMAISSRSIESGEKALARVTLEKALEVLGDLTEVSESEEDNDTAEQVQLDWVSVVDAVQRFPGLAREARSGDGELLLHLAAFRRKTLLCHLLLARGSDPNSRTLETGEAPLHFCAESGAHSNATARVLLLYGADVDATDGKMETPLCHAARFGNMPLVRLLLEHHADVNHASSLQHSPPYTPLCEASAHGHSEIAMLLIDGGARLSPSLTQPYVPYLLARVSGFDALAQLLFRLTLAENM